jgi:hypothetical protein
VRPQSPSPRSPHWLRPPIRQRQTSRQRRLADRRVDTDPVVGSALSAPVPVPGTDGKVHLAYELLLTNALGQEARLTSVAAVADGKTLANLSGDGLAYWIRVLGADAPTTRFGVGVTAVVNLDVAVDQTADVPTSIEHVIGVSLARRIHRWQPP